jgi:hypothetical protein
MDSLGWGSRAIPTTETTLSGSGLTPGVHFYKRADSLGPYEPCNIILRSSPDIATNLNWSGKVTLAARGCDVYIESDILPADSTAALGIVALEDFEMPKAAPRKGGNIYICSRVTDIKNVHVVAEGSILPYGANENECGTLSDRIESSFLADGTTINPRAGLGNFSNPDSSGVVVEPVRETLKNQLVITGSFISLNTSGGAFKSPPEAGDGHRITSPELMDTARFYDYNFFRYAHTVTAPPPTGVTPGTKCWATDVRLAEQFVSTCIGNKANVAPGQLPSTTEKGIMNIQFAPPPSDLPVFNYKAR